MHLLGVGILLFAPVILVSLLLGLASWMPASYDPIGVACSFLAAGGLFGVISDLAVLAMHRSWPETAGTVFDVGPLLDDDGRETAFRYLRGVYRVGESGYCYRTATNVAARQAVVAARASAFEVTGGRAVTVRYCPRWPRLAVPEGSLVKGVVLDLTLAAVCVGLFAAIGGFFGEDSYSPSAVSGI